MKKGCFLFFICLLMLTSVSYGQQKKTDESTPLFRIEQNGKWGFIDKTGKVVIEPQFDDAWLFREGGLASVKIGDKHGYIDKTGKYVWEPTN